MIFYIFDIILFILSILIIIVSFLYLILVLGVIFYDDQNLKKGIKK